MSVGRDALHTLLFQGAALGVGLVNNILIARTLGPEGKGLITFLAYVIFVLTSLASLGQHTAAVQLLGKQAYPPRTLAATQISISLLAWLLCLPVLWLAVPHFGERVGVPSAFLVPLALVTLLNLLQQSLGGILIGLSRLALLNRLQLVVPIAWLGVLLTVVLAGGGDRIVAGYAWMAAMAVAPLLLLGWIVRRVRPAWRDWRACARSVLRFGLEAHVASLLWILLLRADGFLLGAWSGAAVLGVYSMSVLLAELLWYLPRSITLALSPRVSAGAAEEGRKLTERAVRISAVTVAAAAIVLVAVARPLIQLAFGEAFLGAMPAFLLLLPGILCGAVASPIFLYFTQQRGRPRITAVASGIGLALNLALLAWWIPDHGALGAAAASSCAYGVVTVLVLARFAREPGFSWRALWPVRRGDLRLMRDLVLSVTSIDQSGGPD